MLPAPSIHRNTWATAARGPPGTSPSATVAITAATTTSRFMTGIIRPHLARPSSAGGRCPGRLVDDHLVRSRDRIVGERDPVDGAEAVRHGRQHRKPRGEDHEVVRTGALEVAEDAGLALLAIGDDGGGHEPHHVHHLSPRDIGDGAHVIEGHSGSGWRVGRDPPVSYTHLRA